MAKTKTKTKTKDKGGAGPFDRSPSHLLHRALQRALDIYTERCGAEAPTQRQFAVLSVVAEREGLTQADLVKATGIDRSTLADLVARMMSKGLIARERSTDDARANAVSLTDAGRSALAAVAPTAAAADAAILSLLSPGKRDAFLSALRKVAEGEPRKGKKAKKEPSSGVKDKKTRKSKKAKASTGAAPAA